MTDLERKFHLAMREIYLTAKKECGYNATRFLQLISEKGGLAAAKQLILKQSDGFSTLNHYKRLDLSVEAHVLKPEFQNLFTEEERVICKKRLEDCGYFKK